MKLFLKLLPLVFLTSVVLVFFNPFWLKGKLPIPADTIVGLYHPWRDFFAQDYPQGVPFKNFLITDPVRQQYVWRNLSIEAFKNGQWPLWNPYNFSGTPLLANFQSASFYPLNVVFFIFPFNFAWSLLVLLEPFLAGIFLYTYLRNLKLDKWASLLGGVVFSFSGFSVAWMEWNTVFHTALWLPLILLSIDKLVLTKKFKWGLIFILSLVSSFLAGHLQTFFYAFIFSFVYLFFRWWQSEKKIKTAALFIIFYLLSAALTIIQWWPTLKFISFSARSFDLPNWQTLGWFLPPQNLVQFLVPDFFGNPATLNYFGVWNYGEFIGYLGILPLILAFLAIFWRRDRKTLFFSSAVLVSLLFVLPTPLAKLPYQWQVPLISTGQPTRLMFIIDFSLSVLAALGLDWLVKSFNDPHRLKKIVKVTGLMLAAFIGLWLFIFINSANESLLITKRNLILPTLLFMVSAGLIIVSQIKQGIRFQKIILTLFLFLVLFDLFRFGWKFTPFTDGKWLFPETATIKFLKSQPKPFRFMALDRKVFPPNFSAFYRLEDVAGYDPLYLLSYGELVAAWGRGKPDITPFSFNRILTPEDYSSRITDLLGVRYVLSLKEENSDKLKLVFQEGETRVYENLKAFPRAFFVQRVGVAETKSQAANKLFVTDPEKEATIRAGEVFPGRETGKGKVEIVSYKENNILLKTANVQEGFLVLTNSYYPGWQAEIDGRATEIYLTDYVFQGIIVPAGEHNIVFKISL